MVMGYSTSKSPWDFLNPSNWVINKPLEQNLTELSVGMQIIGTTIPSQLAWKAIPKVTPWAIPAASVAAGSAAGAGVGSTAGLTAATAAGMALTGAKLGAGVYALDWLKKNWWIAAVLLGGIIALKMIDKK